MLVRFFSHGKVKKNELSRTGGGGAVRNYLLFDKDNRSKPRDGARLIYGNDIDTTEVINGIKNSKIYTSGVLSFAPEESITDAQKIEIIESFERNLFPGLMKGEYSGYWVEHQDKDRQELHFVFADIHLPSGKALPVYYIGKDFDLVDSWKDLINIDYGLEDPNDPKRQRSYRLKGYEYALKKQQEKDKLAGKAIKDEKVFDEEKIGEWLIEEIADDESIQTQADVIRVIAEAFEITRVAKDGKSISIKNPVGGRNIKLKGMMYEREFTRQRFESLGKTQTRESAKRSELQAINRREREKRKLRLEQRFAQSCEPDGRLSQELSHAEPGIKQRADCESPIANGSVTTTVNSDDSDPLADARANQRESNPDNPERERQSRYNDIGRQQEVNPGNRTSEASLGYDSKSNAEYQRPSHPTYPKNHSGPSTQNATAEQNRVQSLNANRIGDFSGYRFICRKLLSGQTGLSHPADTGYFTTTHRSNPNRNKSTSDGQYLREQGQRGWGADNTEESTNGILGRESKQRKDLTGDRTRKPATTATNAQTEVTQDDSNNPNRANYQDFRAVVDRFAQQSGEPFEPNQPSTADTNHRGFSPIITELTRAAYTDYQSRSQETGDGSQPADTEAGRELLERIRKHQSTTAKNAEIRQGRISTLTAENAIDINGVGQYGIARRRRGKRFARDVTGIDNQLADTNAGIDNLTTGYDERTHRFGQINRRVRSVKAGYDHDAQQFKTATNDFGAVIGTVSALVNAIIELFKKLFNGLKQQVVGYAKEGVLYEVDADGKQQKMNPQQAESYVRSHPYDLSGYAQLTLTVKKLEKDKELRHEPFRGFGM